MKKKYRSFTDAKKFVKSLNLKSVREWSEYLKTGKKPEDIPYDPRQVYGRKKEWASWGDWLGNDYVANQKRKYRSFTDAKKFVKSLNLKNWKDWQEYAKTGKLPKDIPANPPHIYKNKGWKNMADFLGTGTLSGSALRKQYKSFTDAKKFVHSLNLKSVKEWKEYCKSGKKPQEIPANPDSSFKKEWIDMSDWLGILLERSSALKKQYKSFTDAKKFVQKLGLKTRDEWNEYCKSGKKPDYFPGRPSGVYKDEWNGWADFLGTKNFRNKQFLSFEKARTYVQKLGLKTLSEWEMFSKSGKLHDEVPLNPQYIYKNKGWNGWGDFLGTGTLSGSALHKQYKSFTEARKFIHSLKLKTHKEWLEYSKSDKKPREIPANPRSVYLNSGWKGIVDWVGVKRYMRGSSRSFTDAKKFVQKLGLKTRDEWKEYCKSGKKPLDIPINVLQTYKKEWSGWGDFLGTGFVAAKNRKYKSFTEARKFAHSLKIKNLDEWYRYARSDKLPDDIPRAPDSYYAKQGRWIDWGDFLGTGFVATHKRNYLPIKEAKIEARKIVKELGIDSIEKWYAAYDAGKIPKNIPKYLYHYNPKSKRRRMKK